VLHPVARWAVLLILALAATSLPLVDSARAATDYETVWAGVDHTCAITPEGAADRLGIDTAGQSQDRASPFVTDDHGLRPLRLRAAGSARHRGSSGVRRNTRSRTRLVAEGTHRFGHRVTDGRC
jgi:hypothetical protein